MNIWLIISGVASLVVVLMCVWRFCLAVAIGLFTNYEATTATSSTLRDCVW